MAPDGKLYHPEIFLYIFEDLKSKNITINQFQIIQKEIDLLEIVLISNGKFSQEIENIITSRVQSDLHPSFKTFFSYTDHISREKSGKLRVVKSEIKGGL